MAARLRVYLDTSVISAYFDARDPGRSDLTRRCWQQLSKWNATISELVLEELRATADADLRAKMLSLVEPLPVLPWEARMDDLVAAYTAAGAFSATLRADARHVAAAVVAEVPIVVSWNFRHLVNRARRIMVNVVNAAQGYNQIEIIAPPELE